MQENKGRKQKIIFCVICAVLALAAGSAGAYLLWEEAPVVATAEPTVPPVMPKPLEVAEATPVPTEMMGDGEALLTVRQNGVYTMLIAGVDEGGGNTDTIMVGKLDTVNHTINFISIPRDTLVNVGWPLKKINSVYAGAGEGVEGMEALKQHIRRITGFNVDCYALIDMQVLIDAVDTIGGIEFDVPMDMFYDIGPYIDLKAGYQTLSGEEVLGLLRFRSGYLTGDIGRLEMQHSFLKAAAEQFIRLGNVPNYSKLMKILTNGLLTDLAPENIAYFLRQAILCDSEDINFYTMPYAAVYLHDYSYVTVELYDWIQMVNRYINPYEEAVGYGNVDIIYRNPDGSFHGTAGILDPGYFIPPSPSPSPSPEPSPSPSPEDEPVSPTEQPTVTAEPVPTELPVPTEESTAEE